jgi:type III pantothenate kinase
VSVLLIDAGNTRIKWRYQGDGGVVHRGGCAHADVAAQQWPAVGRALVASVHDNPGLHQQLQQQFADRLVWLSHPLLDYTDFQHCYPNPERLGVDRWLAMLGARKHSDADVLVVDAGTAMTVDFLLSDNQHEGGFIVPGLTLAQQMLWQNTERVRPYLDEMASEQLQPGRDTVQCVTAGVRRQQVAFVRNVLEDYEGYIPFFTGGDGEWLAVALDVPYWPELIFDGLDTLCAGYFSAW